MALEDNFLGRGWGFPPQFGRDGVLMAAGLADIEQSLQILLTTHFQERLMLPDFGCDLAELQFEPISTTLRTRVEDLIQTAILLYESRIDPLGVEATEPEPGLLLLDVQFRVRSTNSRHNIVFPFYKTEATDR